MSLAEKIQADFHLALKDKQATVISTLRLLKSELIKKEKEKGDKEMNDEVVTQAIKAQIKQRRDSITEYEKGGREDLAAKEKEEMVILEKYLPAQLPEAEIKAIVDGVVAKLAEDERANFGKVMGAVMKELKGAADGNTVNWLVKEALTTSK